MTKKIVSSSGVTWKYGYDNKNHLTSVDKWSEDPDTYGTAVLQMSAEYKYDALQNRIEKSVDSDGEGAGDPTVTRYAYDGWNPAKGSPVGTENFDAWAVLDGSSSLTSRNLDGDRVDQHLGFASGGTAYWQLTDHLGSVRKVLDNAATVKDALVYDAFGNIESETDSAFRGLYAWTGREVDAETQLQFNRARYYDPLTARWISQDPLGFDAGDSNLYRYVNNMMTMATDGSGTMIGISLSTLVLPNVFAPPSLWLPDTTYYYRDPWVERKQGESRNMIIATIRARIIDVDLRKGTYVLRIRISSAVPMQKVGNKLVKGGVLPAGVNLRTEAFLRKLDPLNRPIPGKAGIDLNYTVAPLQTPSVNGNPMAWKLPAKLAEPENVVWAVFPNTNIPVRPSTVTIDTVFRMWARSGEGSGRVQMQGINTNADGTPIPVPTLPMRPIYLRWSFDWNARNGFIRIEQHGDPFISK